MLHLVGDLRNLGPAALTALLCNNLVDLRCRKTSSDRTETVRDELLTSSVDK